MKKFLLSIFAVLFAFAGVQAQEVTGNAKETYGDATISITEFEVAPVKLTFSKGSGSSAPAYNKDGDCRIYAKNTITATCSTGTLTRIVFTVSAQGLKRLTDLTPSTGTVTIADDKSTITWEGNASEVIMTVGSSAVYGTDGSSKAGQICFTEFTATYTTAGGEVVPTAEKPKFTPESCEFDLGGSVTVEISAAEGATIYYTTDGENPTEESDMYVNALTITETTTVKAIAVIEGHNNSAVAEATYTAVDPNLVTETIVASEAGIANGIAVETLKFGNVTATFDKGSNKQNATKYYSSGTAFRAYSGNTITFTGDAGVTINSVVFTFGTGDSSNEITVDCGTYSNGTWTGASNKVVFTIGGTTGNRRLAEIAVTYSVEKGVIATPSIAGEATFVGSTTVEITNNAEGTTLYYSTNGVDYFAYNSALNITETTTVSAYAQDAQGNKSSVAEATFTKLETLSIAEAKAAYDAAGTGVDVVIDLTGAVVTVNSGQYMFIQDSESGINVYNSGKTYPVGTKFTSGLLVGSSAAYNGMHQIAAGAKFEGVETTMADITPIVVTVAQLNADYAAYEGRYVKLEDVALSGTTITQGDETYTLFNRFGITLEDADLCDIEGVPACFETTLQIFPTKIIPAATVELPEVSVTSGTTIEQGAEITITPAVDNVVTYSVNGAAAVEIDGETIIVANEIGEMTLVVTSTYGGETLTETYTYTVVAPIEKVTAMLTSEDIMAIGTSSSRYEDIEVASACGVWTGLSYINKAGYLQLRSTEGEYIQSPIFPGRILSVTLTIKNTNKRTFTVSDIDGNKLAENNNEGIAGEELLFNITSDVTAFKVESSGTTQISNIYVVYEKPADFQLSISEAGWATLYLGLDASIPAGVKCYTIAEDAVNAESVTLSQFEGNVLPAHTAVIVEANEDVYTFEYADNYSGLLSGNLLKGSITDTYVEGDAYVLGNKDGIGLYKAVLNKNEAGEAGTTHFKNNANKAYLPASALTPAQQTAAFYGFDWEGTTGISEVKGESGNVKGIYDLTGRRVEAITAPGIYVVNGKKVLVK